MSAKRQFWQVIDDGVLIRWEEDDRGNFVRFAGPLGLVVYGPVSFEKLRAIPLSKLQPHVDGLPEFKGATVPTEVQVRAAWEASSAERLDDKRWDLYTLHFPPRSEDEDVDTFYLRVADFYRLATIKTGEPTKSLAESAEVPKSTASRWIRVARERGYLSPTTKGRRSG